VGRCGGGGGCGGGGRGGGEGGGGGGGGGAPKGGMVALRLSFRNTLVGTGRVVSLLLDTNRLQKAPINNLSGNGLGTCPKARWPKVHSIVFYDRTTTERKIHSILNGMGWSQAEGQSLLTAQTSYWCAMWSAVLSGSNTSQSRSQSVTSLKRSSGSIFTSRPRAKHAASWS